MKKVAPFVLMLSFLLLFTGCGQTENPTETSNPNPTEPMSTTQATEVPETTEQLHTQPSIPDGTVALSREECEKLTEQFTQKFAKKGEEIPEKNWYNMVMTCKFDAPEKVNLRQLFGCGIQVNNRPEIGDDELEFLKTQEQIHLYLDLYKLPKERMDEILKTYLGITLDEAEGVGLDQMAYLADTDCYYCNVTGDPFVDPVNVTGGWHTQDGKIVMMYSRTYTYQMTLIPTENGYLVESNIQTSTYPNS